jgi:hypothetical protein
MIVRYTGAADVKNPLQINRSCHTADQIEPHRSMFMLDHPLAAQLAVV